MNNFAFMSFIMQNSDNSTFKTQWKVEYRAFIEFIL